MFLLPRNIRIRIDLRVEFREGLVSSSKDIFELGVQGIDKRLSAYVYNCGRGEYVFGRTVNCACSLMELLSCFLQYCVVLQYL